MPKIGTTIALDGEQKYLQSLRNARNAVKQLGDELKDLAGENKESANSLEYLEQKQELLTKQTENYKRQLENAKTGQSAARKAFKEQADQLGELRKEYEDVNRALKEFEKAGDNSSDAYKLLSSESERLGKALDKQEASYLKAEGRLSKWDNEVSKSQKALDKCNDELSQNEKYLKEASTSANKAATSIDKFGDEVKDTGDDLDQAGQKTSSFSDILLGVAGGTAIVDGIKAIGQAAIEAAEYVFDVGSKFEASMSNVEALSGATEGELDALSSKAKELGSSTKFSASEVADSFGYMALAGWDAEQMLDGIEAVTYMAAAANVDLAESSDMLTDYLSAFGMEAKDAIQVADMLAYAQANSNTTTTQLGDAFSNCAANMNANGQTMRDTVAILEAMANQSDKGSTAGTKLSAVMRDMSQKMEDGAIRVGNMSVAVADSEGNYRSIIDIMADVEAATSGLSETERTTALQSTFTAKSIQAVNEILNEGTGNIKSYAEALDNSQGSAKEMSETMTDNLQGALTEANSALEGLGIAAYEKVKGPATAAVKIATSAIQGLTKAISGTETEADTLISDVKAGTDRIKSALENATEIQTNADEEAARIDVLTRQLITLNGVESKTESQKLRLKGVVQELSKVIPELSGAYDEQTGKVNLTITEIEKLTDAYKEQLKQQALITAQQELYNEAAQAEVDLSIAQSRLDKLKETEAALEEIESMAAKMNSAYDTNGGLNADEVAAGYNEIKDALGEALNYSLLTQEEYKSILDRMHENSTDWFDVADSGFYSIITNMKTALDIEGAENAVDKYGKALGEATEMLDLLDKKTEESTEVADTFWHEGLSQITDDAHDISFVQDSITSGFVGMAEKTKEAADANKDLVDSNGEVVESEEAVQHAQDLSAIVAERIKTKHEEMTKAAEEEAKAHAEAAKRIQEAYEGAKESITKSLEDIHKSAVQNLNFDFTSEEFNGGIEATVGQLLDRAEIQLEGLEHYNENLKTVSDHLGQEIAPEFLEYLEGMGTNGANILAEIAKEFETDDGPAKVKALSDKYVEALNIQQSAADTIAADTIAIRASLGELKESTEAEYQSLFDALAGASDGGDWDGLTESLSKQLEEAALVAKTIGAKIPQNLQEGISSGEISPDAALNQLDAAIQGHMAGLAEEAEKQGLDITENISSGITSGGQATIDAYNEIISAITNTDTNVEAEAQTQGESAGEGYKTGIENKQSDVGTAAAGVTTAAQTELEKTDGFTGAGEKAGTAFAAGLASKTGMTQTAAHSLIEAARAALNNTSGFHDVGIYIDYGVASGIYGGASAVINAAAQTASAALLAMKRVLGIASPSKKFRDEVGAQISAGVAFGIQDKEVLAKKSAAKLSTDVYNSATDWLRKYKRAHDVSLDDEEYYWRQVLKHVKEGTTAYGKAIKSLNDVILKYNQQVIQSQTSLTSEDAMKIASNFGVLDYDLETTTKKVKNKKGKTVTKEVTKQVKKDLETYYSEIMSAANKYFNNQQVVRDISSQQELEYWTAVRNHLRQGTQAWYDATKKINDAQADIEQSQVDAAEAAAQAIEDYYDSIISDTETRIRHEKILNDISEQQQLDYWKAARGQLTMYTEQWYDATEKIKDLQKSISEQQLTQIEEEKQARAEAVANHLERETQYLELLKQYGLKAGQYDAAIADGVTKINNKSMAIYWGYLRQQYAFGTDERIEADRMFKETAETYYNERLQLDKDYQSQFSNITDKLKGDVQNVTDTYEEMVKTTREAIMSQMSLFDAWDSEGYTGEKLIENLRSQVEGLAAWQEDLHELTSRGILSSELIRYLDSMGPDAAANIYSLKQMTDAELEEYQRLYDLRNQLASEAATRSHEGHLLEANVDIYNLKAVAKRDLEALQQAYEEAAQEMDYNIFSGEMMFNILNWLTAWSDSSNNAFLKTYAQSQLNEVGKDIFEELWKSQNDLLNGRNFVVGSNSQTGIWASGIEPLLAEADGRIIATAREIVPEMEQIGIDGLSALITGWTDEQRISDAAHAIADTFKQELLLAQLEAGTEYDSLLTRMNNLNVGSFGLINEAVAIQAAMQPGIKINMDGSGLSSSLSDIVLTLASALQNLSVVMDTGELVGAISGPLSQTLADNTIRETGGRL